MYDHIVIRYAEIALKGKNQKDFLNRLVHNIKEQVKTDLDITPVIPVGKIFYEETSITTQISSTPKTRRSISSAIS